jgi:hypothetical protein
MLSRNTVDDLGIMFDIVRVFLHGGVAELFRQAPATATFFAGSIQIRRKTYGEVK